MDSVASDAGPRNLLGRLLGLLLCTTTLVAISVVAAPPTAADPGDGVIDVGAGETCDDADLDAGDGCDATGQIEAGWTCTGQPSVCTTTVGDGVVAGSEQCDDADLDAGDGCDATGQIEAGWSCQGQPSVCTTTMGDGVVAGSEQCDDGDLDSGDGCSSTGQVELFYSCEGEPSVCLLLVVANLTKPTIVGRTVVGETLTARKGTWDQDGLTFTYRWFVDGAPIGGFSSSRTFLLRKAYVGDKVRVLVKATKPGYKPGKASSAQTDRIRR